MPEQQASTIAALYVQTNGAYFGLPGVEPWDELRDARLYAGPHPVVAHPPCTRWCRLASLVQARYPQHRKGEDGGCFKAALAAVRTWGGVLEHPAYTDAWAAFGLPIPPPDGGWLRTFCGGWVCHVEQFRYGHAARKATWLYVHGVRDLPALRWGVTPRDSRFHGARVGAFTHELRTPPPAIVSACANHSRPGETRRRIMKREASATPPAFKEVLLSLARSVR